MAEAGAIESRARRSASIGDALRRFWRLRPGLRGLALLTPALIILIVMMVAPLLLTIALSFASQKGFVIDRTPTLANYAVLFAPEGKLYRILIWKSLWMSFTATIAVVLLAYPMAYYLAFRVHRRKLLWIILITVPFWTSYLLRVFAWKVILGYNGAINSGLVSLGIIEKPLEFLLYNPTAVTITLAHAWAAYAILPIYVSLEKIDRSLLEAATDLGDGPLRRFLRITFPLSLPGTIAATLLVFIPTVGDYLTPSLVGGTSGIMVGNSIAALYGKANNGPMGAALSIAMMLAITLVVCAFLALIGPKRLRRKGA
ncbi:ABC transporter permease [Dongia sp.]|uniref:ABC transporter permease n=1 Tax=Dongia sp. TaxID=1977262 RepID=UPI003750EB50